MITDHGFDHIMCGACWTDIYASRLSYYNNFGGIEECCWCNRLTSAGTIYWSPQAPQKCPDRPEYPGRHR